MKKIIVDKNEGIAEVIDRVLAAADSDILLVIPKGSALAKSASNFRLLKREAGEADKKVVVESGDEAIIDLATANGIAIAGANARPSYVAGGVSDIVLKRHDEEEDAQPARHGKKEAGVKLTVHGDLADDDDDAVDDEEDDKQEQKSFLSADRFFKPRVIPAAANGDRDDDDDEDESRGGPGKAIAWTIGIILVLGIIFFGVTIVFGRAQVTIDFTQTPWSYQANFIADKNATAINAPATGAAGAAVAAATTIPAQVFTTQKNITQLFPATGAAAQVSTRAQGTITIYNDYSSAPQDLVATTRFLTPDGKIFRLVNNVTVPAAQVASSGAITPTSITAPIIADQGGPAYNVGPVAKLTIPGFQNNPGRYAGFYGAITGMTTGGFTGTKMVPTAADIATAKASTTAILQADLQAGLTASYPNNFKILDGATDIAITKLTVNTSTDANGNFSVFGEASLTAIGFDQSALENYLLSLAQGQVAGGSGASVGGSGGSGGSTGVGGTTMAFKNFANPNYSNVQASFSKGQVSFALSATETLEPAFSSSDFAGSIAGKNIGDARDAIQNLPQLSNGTISVWPVWLWSMPGNPSKISVDVN